jgi:tetratricopeptide (TPR) repeat protein
MAGTAPSDALPEPPGTGSMPGAADAAGGPADRFRYDVFVSYSKTDADWTWDWLLPRLKAAGLTVCIDEESFEPGAPVASEIERAVRESRRTLAILSPAWVASEWAGFESLLVNRQDPNARWRRLIPLLLEPCQPPDRIQLLHWIDLSAEDSREAQVQRVVAAIQGRSALPELRLDAFPEPRRRRSELRWYAIAGVAAVLTLAVLVGWIVLQQRGPTAMPSDGFNIAVAEFRAVDQAGQPIKDPAAVERASSIAGFLGGQTDALSQVLSQKVNVWGPEHHINPIKPGDEVQRAAALNADVLVYGVLRQSGDVRWRLEPAFWLADEKAIQRAEELRGEHALGTPIDYLAGNTASEGELNRNLDVRLRALVKLLNGLSFYTWGNREGFKSAATAFQQAATDPGWGAVDDDTGQEVLYLFLGNARLKESQFLEEDPPARAALLQAGEAAFERAVALNSEYARSYNGLGGALLQMARPLSSDPDECHWNWDELIAAQEAYTKALAARAEAKPPSGFVDLRAHLGLGQTYFWQAKCPPQPDQQAQARSHLQTALDLYSALPPADQTLLVPEAALVHTLRGHLAQSPAEAIPEYAAVVMLAQQKQTTSEELQRQASEIMPYLLTAYCLDGQSANASSALDSFVTPLPNSAAARAAILDRLAPETRKDCLPN